MEETLGKRIAAWRRRVGMTQDQLAERLGVTAQAVSKWENDQSCPDIATLPRLAEIFSVTTDQLLGVPQKEEVHTGEVVTEKDEDKHSLFEIDLSGSKKDALGLGIWVLLSGALLLLNNHFNQNGGIWESLMIAGLLTIGFMGIRRHFFISLACILFGTYEGLNNFYSPAGYWNYGNLGGVPHGPGTEHPGGCPAKSQEKKNPHYPRRQSHYFERHGIC